MKILLSSRMTFFYKFIFPISFILLSANFFYNNISKFNFNQSILFISILFIIGLIIYNFLCRLKEIYIIDGNIFITNFIKTIKIDKNEILYINHFLFSGPQLIWIHFKNKTQFGYYIIFTPYFKFFSFFQHPVFHHIKPDHNVKPVNKKNNFGDIAIVLFILFWIILWTYLLLNGIMKK